MPHAKCCDFAKERLSLRIDSAEHNDHAKHLKLNAKFRSTSDLIKFPTD